MNREQIADISSGQFGQLYCLAEVRKRDRTKAPLTPGLSWSALDVIKFENQRDEQIAYRDSEMARLNAAARTLYKEHPAEFYELARDAMEAEGISFSFGEEIAAIEESSPLNGLGAKILHIGQMYGGRVEEALA